MTQQQTDETVVEHRAHADEHTHQHGADCGHETVTHDDHVDYVHDGHHHASHDDHWDDHH